MRALGLIVVAAVAGVLAAAAAAQAPKVEFVQANDVEVFSGADSPCRVGARVQRPVGRERHGALRRARAVESHGWGGSRGDVSS
jgi:hypothetical protein